MSIQPNILIPMIRRTFPEIIAKDIIGVQPMSGPSGVLFTMNTKFVDVETEIQQKKIEDLIGKDMSGLTDL